MGFRLLRTVKDKPATPYEREHEQQQPHSFLPSPHQFHFSTPSKMVIYMLYGVNTGFYFSRVQCNTLSRYKSKVSIYPEVHLHKACEELIL